MHFYITGDCHGQFERIWEFCSEHNTNQNDVLIILGDSGSLYQLLTEEMNTELTEETKEKLSQFEIVDGAAMKEKLDEVKEALEKKQKLVGEAENTAKDNMDEDGLYLIMEHMHVVKAILKKDTAFREIHASVHVGMFQDSVLITDWMEGEVDFRYFPNHMMEPYHWSDGLLSLIHI